MKAGVDQAIEVDEETFLALPEKNTNMKKLSGVVLA